MEGGYMIVLVRKLHHIPNMHGDEYLAPWPGECQTFMKVIWIITDAVNIRNFGKIKDIGTIYGINNIKETCRFKDIRDIKDIGSIKDIGCQVFCQNKEQTIHST
jgi:hypothetical protein